MRAVGLVLVAALVSGCTAADDTRAPDRSLTAGVLPADLAVPGADLVERNATFARFVWTGTAPPGTEATAPDAATLVVPVPGGVPLAFLAGLRHERLPGASALVLEVADAEGEAWCRADGWAEIENGRMRSTCAPAVRPARLADEWRVRVLSVGVPPPGLAVGRR